MNSHAIRLIAGLGVQFLLGIWTNLFVSFPDTTDAGQLWKFALTQPVVIAHIIIGTLLVLGSLALLIRAFQSGNRLWKIGSGLGFGALLLAWASGREFVSSQSDAASFAMATFFMLAILAYTITLFLSLKQAPSKAAA